MILDMATEIVCYELLSFDKAQELAELILTMQEKKGMQPPKHLLFYENVYGGKSSRTEDSWEKE